MSQGITRSGGKTMFRSQAFISVSARALAVVFAVALGNLAASSPASAAVTVSRAEANGGDLRIEGRAIEDRTITVDAVAMGTSDGDGDFRVSRSGYSTPADCTVAVDDGSLRPVTVTLSGCTVTAAPAAAMLPDTSEIGPFKVGVQLPTTVVSLSNAIGPTQWEVTAGALPSGLSLVVPEPGGRPSPPENQTYAEIRGTPTTVQTSTFTLRATDARGLTATRTYTIRIDPAPALDITPHSWPPLRVDEGANLWFTGSGGLRPYRWQLSAGTVPPGMTLIQDNSDSELVRIGGTPTTSGTFAWTLRLTDSQGTTFERTFTATVTSASSLSSLAISPAQVTAGSSATGTVTLNGPAPGAGAEVALSSSDPAVAAVNVRVFVPAASTTGTFPISTAAVTSTTVVTVTASYDGATRSSTITVEPAIPDPVAVSGLGLVPSTVTGGSGTSTGTVTLNADAPPGGALIDVTSSSPAATVPATVTVLAGTTSATFTIDTTAVATPTSVTIAATYGASTRTATQTVAPPSDVPPELSAPSLVSPANDARWAPGVSRTFDWTDVSGVATYTVQVSTSSAFTTIQLERTVTASQTALSFSSQGTRYWRVRANDSAGRAGPWSATRSFRIKG
jgi:hypothetical protein